MVQNGKSTSTFTSFTAKAGSALKSFGAALASIGVNWAISELISLAVEGFDELINSAEHCKERVDELMSSYQSALDEANSNAQTVEELASLKQHYSKAPYESKHNLTEQTIQNAMHYLFYDSKRHALFILCML